MARCCSRPVLVGLVLAAASCGGTEHQSASAVWSDDQSEVLVVISRWEQGVVGYMGAHSLDNFRFEVRTYSLDGTRLRTIVNETAGESNRAWYMRSAGYALLRYVAGDCCTASQPYVTERISLDGSRQTLESGLATTWLPSPDGSVLAHVGGLVGDCSPLGVCTHMLTFFDARTLDPLGAPTAIDFANGEQRYLFWTPSAELYAYSESSAFDTGYMSVLVTPGSPPRPVEPLPCTQDMPRPSILPQTSSDFVSHDGRLLRAAVNDAGDVTLSVEDSGMPGWPGACFPDAAP